MPYWYVDNEYINLGYRRITNSYAGCIKSLAYLHNETGNIYTHGVGVIGFMLVTFMFYNAWTIKTDRLSDLLIIGTFFFGAIVCLGLSTAFHLCCCHSKHVCVMWNKADYLGIVILIIGSFVPVVYYGFYCNPIPQKLYLAMITIFGFGTIFISVSNRFSSPQYRYLRTLLFTSMGLSGILPLVHSFVIYGFVLSTRTFAADKIIFMGILYVSGGISLQILIN
jgi:adiponectin receptor